MKRFKIATRTAIMFRGKAYRTGDESAFLGAITEYPHELVDVGADGADRILAFYVGRGAIIGHPEESQDTQEATEPQNGPRNRAKKTPPKDSGQEAIGQPEPIQDQPEEN